jgi:hypothetical protein
MSRPNKTSFIRYFNIYLLTFILLSLSILPTQAQKKEVGIMFGGTYYLGDLNPSQQFMMTRVGAGALFRYNFNPHLSLRANVLYGSVEGNDTISGYNENRNLSFRSNFFETSIQFEVNFLPFIAGDMDSPGTPYIFAGGGGFYYNPRTQYEGQWIDLRPLGTEGQGSEMYPDRTPYSPFSYNLLFGVGYKFNITSRISAAFEWGMRRTGTDYLDDVSTTYPHPSVFANNPLALELHDRSINNRGENTNFQRGNPNVKDWYSFAGMTLTYRIKDRSRLKCPAYN